MRVAMLSWEYPPKVIGGLAQHVYDLSTALVKKGVEVFLLTHGVHGAPEFEKINGVKVWRVNPYQVSAPDFPARVVQFNVAMLERAIPLLNKLGNIDILHAHDWLVAYAARALKHACKLPLVVTIHATEYGRNHGLHNDLQRHISDVEWWLTYEAWRVICCSRYMEGEVKFIFQLPPDKLTIIPNGVNPESFIVKEEKIRRDNFAAPDEKIVFCIGRLVREKGVQILLDAIPEVLASYSKTKFIIAGTGPYAESLRQQVQRLSIASKVYFTGYINEETRNALYRWASVAVFPSLYEPFGIVALEAMAALTPVVVADTGGFKEIVQHGVNGLKSQPGSSHSLAEQILKVLSNPEFSESLRRNAYQRVKQDFNWSRVAGKTISVYQEVVYASKNSSWRTLETTRGWIMDRFSKLKGRYA